MAQPYLNHCKELITINYWSDPQLTFRANGESSTWLLNLLEIAPNLIDFRKRKGHDWIIFNYKFVQLEGDQEVINNNNNLMKAVIV